MKFIKTPGKIDKSEKKKSFKKSKINKIKKFIKTREKV